MTRQNGKTRSNQAQENRVRGFYTFPTPSSIFTPAFPGGGWGWGGGASASPLIHPSTQAYPIPNLHSTTTPKKQPLLFLLVSSPKACEGQHIVFDAQDIKRIMVCTRAGSKCGCSRMGKGNQHGLSFLPNTTRLIMQIQSSQSTFDSALERSALISL